MGYAADGGGGAGVWMCGEGGDGVDKGGLDYGRERGWDYD